MAEANGVFVKIFRDKGAWKQNEGLLETVKGKFEAEGEYRKKLAVEAGLTEEQAKLNFNPHIDPSLFYPEFDCDSPEYIAWRSGFAEKQCYSASKEQETNIDRNLGWPTESIEELSLVRKFHFFESTLWFVDDSSGRYLYKVFFGIRGNKRYLVAWWGEKEYYDKIQQKLEDLKEAKRKEEEEKIKLLEKRFETKKVDENPKVRLKGSWGRRRLSDWSFSEELVALLSIVGLVFFVVVVLPVMYESTNEFWNTSNQTVEEPLTPHECDQLLSHSETFSSTIFRKYEVLGKQIRKCKTHGEHLILDCRLYYSGKDARLIVGKEVFDSFKVGDIIEEKNRKEKGDKQIDKRCNYTVFLLHHSVYELPVGEVLVKKEPFNCSCGQCYWLEYSRDPSLSCKVTKAVFDKVKVGDKVPFKKPEY